MISLKNPIIIFGLGLAAGYILRGFGTKIAMEGEGEIDQYPGGYHNGVWYDDMVATPINHTIFGPFANDYEDRFAGAEGPAGLTPSPMNIGLTVA